MHGVLKKSPPKVIHVTWTWLPQTLTWLYNQIACLNDSVESHIFCEDVENLDQFGIKNVHLFSDLPKPVFYWDRILRKLGVRKHLHAIVRLGRKIKVDIIHSHFGSVGWSNLGAAKSLRARHVVTFYGLDVNYLPRQDPKWKSRYASLFTQAERFLCEGSFMAQSLEKLGCPHEKIRIHHLGVKVEDIPFKLREWDGVEPLRILIAAAFREKKGIPYALRAAARLRKDFDVRITIIGDANKDPRNLLEKKRILETISELGMEGYTHLRGYQPQKELFREAYANHIFLSPSITAEDGDTEGGAPVAVIEMGASGMPVVSSFHCDIPEIITHGLSGLLSEERDVDGIENNLRWLAENRQRWAELCLNSRRHVENEYDCAIQAEKLAGIYNGLL